MTDNDAHLAYIVSQTKQNVEFLLSQGQIGNADAQDMLAKLSKVLQTKQLGGPEVKPMPEFAIVPITRPAQNPPGGATHARAIWGYNEQRQVTNSPSEKTPLSHSISRTPVTLHFMLVI